MQKVTKVFNEKTLIPVLLLIVVIGIVAYFSKGKYYEIVGVSFALFILFAIGKTISSTQSHFKKTIFERFAEDNLKEEARIRITLRSLGFLDSMVVRKLIGFGKTKKRTLMQVAMEHGVDPDHVLSIWKKFLLLYNRVRV